MLGNFHIHLHLIPHMIGQKYRDEVCASGAYFRRQTRNLPTPISFGSASACTSKNYHTAYHLSSPTTLRVLGRSPISMVLALRLLRKSWKSWFSADSALHRLRTVQMGIFLGMDTPARKFGLFDSHRKRVATPGPSALRDTIHTWIIRPSTSPWHKCV